MNAELLFGLGAPLATLLVLSKWLLNHFAPVRRRTASTCGCGHDFAFHDLANGRCGGHARIETYSSVRYSECGCKQFTGSMA